VHPPTMKHSIKAKRERSDEKIPEKPEAYFEWDQASLLDALQRRITKKDEGAKRSKGGPYARYMLVIWPAEATLYRDAVQKFLESSLVSDITLVPMDVRRAVVSALIGEGLTKSTTASSNGAAAREARQRATLPKGDVELAG
jgi:hypothetical protein